MVGVSDSDASLSLGGKKGVCQVAIQRGIVQVREAHDDEKGMGAGSCRCTSAKNWIDGGGGLLGTDLGREREY
jgi:hypothetical protein